MSCIEIKKMQFSVLRDYRKNIINWKCFHYGNYMEMPYPQKCTKNAFIIKKESQWSEIQEKFTDRIRLLYACLKSKAWQSP